MSFTIDLSGKCALVTGASRGIGRAILRALVEAGAHVIAVARAPGPLEEAVAEVTAKGGSAQAVAGDLTDAGFIDTLLKVQAEAGGVELLVNNAAITRDNLFIRMSDEDWSAVLDANLTAVFRLCKVMARPMLKKRRGRIVMVSSVVGLSGNEGQANYAASKAGLIGLAKTLARELAGRTITVNVVCPGYTATDMTAALPESLREAAKSRILLGRFAEPGEIAAGVLFLCSDQAAYITGAVLPIDGGVSA